MDSQENEKRTLDEQIEYQTELHRRIKSYYCTKSKLIYGKELQNPQVN